MKTTFSRKEVDRLLRVLEWIDTATLAGEDDKNELKEIAMKLKVAIKNNPGDKKFEFLVE